MEQQILFVINRQWTSPALDLFMATMSSFDLWRWPIVAAVLGSLFFGGFKARTMLVVLGLAIGLGEGAVSGPLKQVVKRPRPYELLANVRRIDLRRAKPRVLALFKIPKQRMSRPKEGMVEGHSFPSSHTTNNFCIATVLTAFYRRWGWLYFIPAAVVGYSRIYVGSHWPSDILISILLGFGVALLSIALMESLWRRFGARLLPNTRAAHPSLIAALPA